MGCSEATAFATNTEKEAFVVKKKEIEMGDQVSCRTHDTVCKIWESLFGCSREYTIAKTTAKVSKLLKEMVDVYNKRDDFLRVSNNNIKLYVLRIP